MNIHAEKTNAELVKTSKFHEMEFYIMPKKTESEIYYKIQIDFTNTFKFLEKFNKDKEENTILL